MKRFVDEFSLEAELKRIKEWIRKYDYPNDFKWVKKLIDKIGLKDFNLNFVTYDTTSLNPAYIDLDSAYLLYQELFE